MTDFTRRPVLLGLSFALLFIFGCGGGGGDGQTDPDVPTDLVVQRTLPTNGQEVLNDLSDVAGIVEVKFSERLLAKSVLDANNAFNGLSSDVNILDSSFARVPGTPAITGERGNILTFKPAGGVLPNGQYTVTATRDVLNWAGGRLNNGKSDHRSAFTVGVDTYTPVVRTSFPVPNQKDVPKDSSIIIIFNESLNPATVTNSTVVVTDAQGNNLSQAPFQPIITTSRDDFEIVFTPDPATLLPPSTTITVTLTGGPSGITDVVGNPFAGDPPGTDVYQFQFETVREPPPPNSPPPLVLNPMDPRFPDAAVYFATQKEIGVLREQPYLLAGFQDLAPWTTEGTNPIPNSIKKVGKPEEIVVDQRAGPVDLHTWLYVIERSTRSVAIVSTRTSNVIHKWKQLPDPRGLGINAAGSQLFVSNYTSDTVSVLDIGAVTPGSETVNDFVKSVADLPKQDSTFGRRDILLGRGPTGVAHSWDSTNLYVASALDNQGYRIDSRTGVIQTTISTGTNPVDIASTFYIGPSFGWFNFFSCLGGDGDPDGSVTLYWYGPSWGYDEVVANITGFKNPKGTFYPWFTTSVWIANSGGDTCTELVLTFSGALGFGGFITASLNSNVTVGKNPNSVTGEAFADRGEGQLSFIDRNAPLRVPVTIKVPGAHEVATILDQ
jgi:DNA-binding beta-propeller fold protein YncE